jgi:hypothetical protein
MKCETVNAEYIIMRTSSVLADNTIEYSMRTNHLTDEMKKAFDRKQTRDTNIR